MDNHEVITLADHPVEHAVSLGLPAGAVVSFLAQWSPVFTAVLTLLGFCWYFVLFYDRFIKVRKDHES